MKLFHGANTVIKKVDWDRCKPKNDYGKAFYMCDQYDMAAEWAAYMRGEGVVNEYELDDELLSVFDFMDGESNIFEWLATLLYYRQLRWSAPNEKANVDFLIEHFQLDMERYDLVIGYRADDSYFTFAQQFVSGQISVQQLKQAIAAGHLLDQYALIAPPPNALDPSEYLHFIDAYKLTDKENAFFYNAAAQRSSRATNFVNSLVLDVSDYNISDLLRAYANEDELQISQIIEAGGIHAQYR